MITRNAEKTAQLKVLMNSQSPELGMALSLIKEGADPDTVDSNGNTLIHRLSIHNNNQKGKFNKFIIQLVKKFGANINIQNNMGFTPLQCLFNINGVTPEQVMSFISLDLGINVNVLDASGQSFIHRISGVLNNKSDYTSMMKNLIVKYGADINILDSNGYTPFQCALNNPAVFMFAMVQLILLGANPNVLSAIGDSFLERSIHPTINHNGKHEKRIEQLVKDYPMAVDFPNRWGLTPLQTLLDRQNLFYPSITLLLSLGANPNQLNSNGDSLLHLLPLHLTDHSHIVLYDLIKQYKADIHIKNALNQTPLECVLNSVPVHTQLSLKLIELGADEESTDREGRTLFKILSDPARKSNAVVFEQLKELKKIRAERRVLLDFMRQARSGFINFLLIIAHAKYYQLQKNNQQEDKKNPKFSLVDLPYEIIIHIIGCFNFNTMGKTQEEGILLAKAIFGEFSEIKKMLDKPGGINVFQSRNKENGKTEFHFFKSATTLCEDFLMLREKLLDQDHPSLTRLYSKKLSEQSVKKLSWFKEKYALSIWEEHSKLVPPSKLKDEIQSHPLYADVDLKITR